jgi:phosphate butyryltransferase
MIKPLLYSAKAILAGFIVGAKVPVILASRSSTTQDKYLSIVLAAAAC